VSAIPQAAKPARPESGISEKTSIERPDIRDPHQIVGEESLSNLGVDHRPPASATRSGARGPLGGAGKIGLMEIDILRSRLGQQS